MMLFHSKRKIVHVQPALISVEVIDEAYSHFRYMNEQGKWISLDWLRCVPVRCSKKKRRMLRAKNEDQVW